MLNLPRLAQMGTILAAFASAQEAVLIDKVGWPRGNNIGRVVATDGEYLVIGDQTDSAQGSYTGSVRVFDAQTGEALSVIRPDQPLAMMIFGVDVDVQGGLAIIGAPYDSTSVFSGGGAYVFDLQTGQQLHALFPPNLETGDRFGWSVAIHGNLAVIGAPYTDASKPQAGRAYLFDVTTGALITRMRPEEMKKNDHFGTKVSMSGTHAAIGAPGDDDMGYNSGAVYLFELLEQRPYAKLTADAVDDGGVRFGWDIDMTESHVLVGCEGCDVSGLINAGTLFLFDLPVGTQVARIQRETPKENGHFGASVALTEGLILGSAHFDNTIVRIDPRTHLEIGTTPSPDGSIGEFFGQGLAAANGLAWVGAPYHDAFEDNAGAAYGFHMAGVVGENYCLAVPHSGGYSGTLSAWGHAHAGLNQLRLQGHDLPPHTAGMFLNSRSAGFTTLPGADGDLCLSGFIGHDRASLAPTGAGGTLEFVLDLDAIVTPIGPIGITPGDTWHFQAWFRDPAGSSNFTNAVRIEF